VGVLVCSLSFCAAGVSGGHGLSILGSHLFLVLVPQLVSGDHFIVCVFSVVYMGAFVHVAYASPCPGIQPWESRAWWWSRFKEPPNSDKLRQLTTLP
jgi:hypothetical protein